MLSSASILMFAVVLPVRGACFTEARHWETERGGNDPGIEDEMVPQPAQHWNRGTQGN